MKLLRLAAATLMAIGLLISLVWDPVLKTSKSSPVFTAIWILLLGLTPIVWVAWVIRTISGKSHQNMTHRATVGVERSAPNPTEAERNVPAERFSDVGGADDAKEQIRQIVQGHLHPERYQRYGLFRNGILLYGPRGTGKTFLARATAGEFGLNFECISAPKLLTRWTGATGENIQSVFARAAARTPVLFSIDEIDAVGAVRQDAMSDAGGAGRELNNITASLMARSTSTARSMDSYLWPQPIAWMASMRP
jgi:ATP-dependent Zn protease